MRRKILIRIALGVLASGLIGVGLVFVGGIGRGGEDEQGFLANLVSRALSTSATQVHIGGVDGALSSDATIRDIVISDRDGVWLKLDRARLIWRRAALLTRRLEIDSLEIGHLEIRRRPIPADAPVAATDQPLLPDLPVKVEIKQFAMADLDLGAPILGAAMRSASTGRAELGSPSEGLLFHLDGRRLDSPGSLLVALTYVPASNALSVKVKLDEPAGGLVSKIAHLSGEPPVTFDLAGDGTLDAFRGRLDFRAGATIDTTGTIDLQRHDAGRDLAIRLGGHLGALLPSLAGSIFEGQTTLDSDVRLADAGAVTLNSLALTSHLARLDAHGTFDTDKTLDFTASARAMPTDGDVSRAGDASLRKLVFDATVKGPVGAPAVSAKLALADAHVPNGNLDRLDANLTATPNGDVLDAATRIALDASLNATGVKPQDAGLDHAIGGSAVLALQGSMDTRGRAAFRTIELKTPTLSLAYSGDLSSEKIKGRLIGELSDLSRFRDLAGTPLAGRATLDVGLDGSPKTSLVDATVAAGLHDFASGVAEADRLAGPDVKASGRFTTLPNGLYAVRDFTIEGAHIHARVEGNVSPKASDLSAHVALPDLSRADSRLTGVAAIDAHLSGGTDKPDLSLTSTIDSASAMGRPIPHLGLAVDIADLRGTATTRLRLDGSIDQKPATGSFALSRTDDGGWTLGPLDLSVGSVALKGAGSLGPDTLARGSVELSAQNLDDLSPLALIKLGGSLSLAASLSADDGVQNATLRGTGADLRAATSGVRRFDLQFGATDLYRHPVINGDATMSDAAVGGQAIQTVKLSAKGDTAQSAINLSARAAGFDLDAAGALVPGAASRLALTRFSVRRDNRRIALTGPADFVFTNGGVDISHLALALSGGRLGIDGHAGPSLDLNIDARAIPLAIADMAMPGLGLQGTLDASAKLGGTASAPTGPYKVSINRLVAPQTQSAGLPPIDMVATGRLEGRKAILDAKISAGRVGILTATGAVPLDATGALDLSVRGTLDAGAANAKLAPSGRSLTGSVRVDAQVTGSRDKPAASGTAIMSNGTFRDALLGTRLDAISATLKAQGDTIVIERVSASTPNNGTLSASGQIKIDPASGFPGTIILRGHDATLVANGLMNATTNLDIEMSGAFARNPRIGGKIELTRVDIGIPDRLPSTLKPIDGITHVNLPPNETKRLAQKAEQAKLARGTKGRPQLFDAGLDLVVAAPSRIFVRGRGVDAELGGDLHVSGTTSKPILNGAFDLRRGKLAALGKTLNFTKGKLAFNGDLVPELDFAAELQSTNITAQIAVTGPAAAPVFAFTSSPELPQDEILSRVLFQKSSGSLSGLQALQLAQAAAQFSDGGDGAFEKLRKSLGVDSLDIGADAHGPSVGVSRALSDRVSVGIRTGATADQTGLSADIDVTRHIRVQSNVRSNGATSVGVGTEIEY